MELKFLPVQVLFTETQHPTPVSPARLLVKPAQTKLPCVLPVNLVSYGMEYPFVQHVPRIAPYVQVLLHVLVAFLDLNQISVDPVFAPQVWSVIW